MVDVGYNVVCPVCGGKARVVYVSRDEKAMRRQVFATAQL